MKHILPVTVLFLLSMVSCMTYDYVPEEKVVTQKVGDVNFTLTYMTQAELRRLHGSENNPFINLPKGVFQRDMVVFLCEIEAEETVLFIDSPDITMTIGNKTDRAKSVINMMLYWRGYVNETTYNFMFDKAKLLLIPQNFSVRPGKKVKGYLVFLNNFPAEMGQAKISIPAATESGDSGVIDIGFFLDDPRARAAAEKRKQRAQKRKKPGSEGSDGSSIFEDTQPKEEKPSIFENK